MKVRKVFVFPAALFFVSLSTIFCQRAFSIPRSTTILEGSGPVFSSPLQPGGRIVTVQVTNLTNLNAGYDLIDQGDRTVVTNGTIKNRGTVSKSATALPGHTYKLRLRCQEPPWNNTKCRANGSVSW